MNLSKVGINNLHHKINNFYTNPIKGILGSFPKDLSTLKKDVVQITSETEKFLKRLSQEYPNTSNIKINGHSYTKFEGSQMGSNPAFWVKNDKTKELFYIKTAKNYLQKAHLEEEVRACNLYKLAGINAPEVKMCSLGFCEKAMMSKFAPKLEEICNYRDVHKAFAPDAWLANWDTYVNNNTKLNNGDVFKLDNGGALRFRAQGSLKQNFGYKVEDIKTLVDGRNWHSTNAYNNISHDDLIKSFKQVCNINNKDIKKIVKDRDLAQTLIKRKEYMAKVLEKIEKTPQNEKNLIDYFNKLNI